MKKSLILIITMIALISISGCVGDNNTSSEKTWKVNLLTAYYADAETFVVDLQVINIADDHEEHQFASFYQTRLFDKEDNGYGPDAHAFAELGFSYYESLGSGMVPYGGSEHGYLVFKVSPLIELDHIRVAGEKIPIDESSISTSESLGQEIEEVKDVITFSGFEWEIQDVGYGGQTGMSEASIEDNKYHTAQTTASEGGIRLAISDHEFGSEDILEYDIDYNSGSGNVMSRIVINEKRIDDLLGDWKGAIGYWGQDMGFGNEIGTYHIKINFLDDNVKVDITKPNSILISESVSLTAPYTFAFETRTGDNGVCSFDYYNFKVE